MTMMLIHGWGYGPGEGEAKTYPAWRLGLSRPDAMGLCWDSVPQRPGRLVGSWLRGYLYPGACYKRAWDHCHGAAGELKAMLRAVDGRADIVAHSLGTRVVRLALADLTLPMAGRVVLLHGADYKPAWVDLLAKRPGMPVLNVRSDGDQVLRFLGQWFAPDALRRDVIGLQGLPGATEIPVPDSPSLLDDHWIMPWPDIQAWLKPPAIAAVPPDNERNAYEQRRYLGK
jgi:hypothetical protein